MLLCLRNALTHSLAYHWLCPDYAGLTRSTAIGSGSISMVLNRCGDIAIFLWFSRWRQPPSWIFKNSKFLRTNNSSSCWLQVAVGGQCASPCQISSKSVEQSQRYGDLTVFFQNGGRPPSWICWAPVGATHDDHLMVCIVVPNLVKIGAVVSIT